MGRRNRNPLVVIFSPLVNSTQVERKESEGFYAGDPVIIGYHERLRCMIALTQYVVNSSLLLQPYITTSSYLPAFLCLYIYTLPLLPCQFITLHTRNGPLSSLIKGERRLEGRKEMNRGGKEMS